jgi:hypothetical protein
VLQGFKARQMRQNSRLLAKPLPEIGPPKKFPEKRGVFGVLANPAAERRSVAPMEQGILAAVRVWRDGWGSMAGGHNADTRFLLEEEEYSFLICYDQHIM